MKRWTHAALAGIALACLALAAPAALAQAPGGTIRIIVPFAPAGSSDVLARVLQGPLQEELKQTVIVENHAGAGSNLGTVEVARAHPDGNTFLITSSAFVVNPALYKNVPYKSDTDMVKRAKDKPASLNYSSPGNGTTPQLTMELFKLKLGVDLTNIPYGGGGPATQALLGGTVDVLSTALPGAQAQIKGGTMKGIALTTSERWPMLPDVPTFKEVGYPDMSLDTEHFLLAPAGTPLAVIERMSKAAQATLARE